LSSLPRLDPGGFRHMGIDPAVRAMAIRTTRHAALEAT